MTKEKKKSRYAAKHRSDCWYKDTCIIESCKDSCIRFNEMKYLMDTSGIPPAQQIPVTLVSTEDTINEFRRLDEIKKNIVQFVKEGKNLYITSDYTGNGKTSWALKLMLRYFNEIWSGNGFRVRGLFIHVPTFLQQLKNFENPISEEYKQAVLSCDLVIWDDLASTALSAYDYGQLLIYVDSRAIQKKSNIFTSNISRVEELEKLLGGRLTSRIYNSSEVIEIRGKDWRAEK